jgi:hypothetical protein
MKSKRLTVNDRIDIVPEEGQSGGGSATVLSDFFHEAD